MKTLSMSLGALMLGSLAFPLATHAQELAPEGMYCAEFASKPGQPYYSLLIELDGAVRKAFVTKSDNGELLSSFETRVDLKLGDAALVYESHLIRLETPLFKPGYNAELTLLGTGKTIPMICDGFVP